MLHRGRIVSDRVMWSVAGREDPSLPRTIATQIRSEMMAALCSPYLRTLQRYASVTCQFR